MLCGHSHDVRSRLMVKRHFFKLMSKDYHGEVANFSDLVWFRILAKQPKLAEQWREAHWVGKPERSDEHLIRGSTFFSQSDSEKTTCRTVEFGECQSCVVSPWYVRVRTELDAPPTRQKYITNQMLDQHGRTPLCRRCSLGAGSHSSDCRARFEAIWTKELAEADVPIRAEAEVANLAADAVPIDPNVRVSEPVEPAAAAGGQAAAMEVSIDPASQTLVKRNPWRCAVEQRGSYETCSRNTIDAKQH